MAATEEYGAGILCMRKIGLEEESKGLADGPLLLVIARCLLKIQEKILHDLEDAVRIVAIEGIHAEVVRVPQVTVDALPKELVFAGGRSFPYVVGVLLGWLVAQARLASITLRLLFLLLPISLSLPVLVFGIVDAGCIGRSTETNKVISRHRILYEQFVFGANVGRSRDGGPALASGNRRLGCIRTRLYGTAGCRCVQRVWAAF